MYPLTSALIEMLLTDLAANGPKAAETVLDYSNA
jgi:hypothetical protein